MENYRKDKNSPGLDGTPLDVAIKAFKASGIRIALASPHHLKSGAWNYFPSSGTIYRDGAVRREDVTGVDAFIKLVKSR